MFGRSLPNALHASSANTAKDTARRFFDVMRTSDLMKLFLVARLWKAGILGESPERVNNYLGPGSFSAHGGLSGDPSLRARRRRCRRRMRRASKTAKRNDPSSAPSTRFARSGAPSPLV